MIDERSDEHPADQRPEVPDADKQPATPKAHVPRHPTVGVLIAWFGLAIVATLVAGLVMVAGFGIFYSLQGAELEAQLSGPGLLLASVGATCVVLALMALVPLGPKVSYGLTRGAGPMTFVLAALGTTALAQLLGSLVDYAGLQDFGSLGHIREALNTLSPVQLVLAAAFIGLAPGFAEELFFRGTLLTRLRQVSSGQKAWLLSSLGFGLMHLDLVHSPLAFVLGLYLGAITLSTRSLWPAIGAHVVNNAFATYAFRLDTLSPLAALACAVLAALALLRIRKSNGPFFGGAIQDASVRPSVAPSWHESEALKLSDPSPEKKA